jgi:hypothetical protein
MRSARRVHKLGPPDRSRRFAGRTELLPPRRFVSQLYFQLRFVSEWDWCGVQKLGLDASIGPFAAKT